MTPGHCRRWSAFAAMLGMLAVDARGRGGPVRLGTGLERAGGRRRRGPLRSSAGPGLRGAELRVARAAPVKAGNGDAATTWRSFRINAAAERRADSDRVRFLWNGSLNKCKRPRAAGLCLALRGTDLGVSSLFCSRSSSRF